MPGLPVFAQGGEVLLFLLFVAISIGSWIVKARAEARAREEQARKRPGTDRPPAPGRQEAPRRMQAEVEKFLRQIGLEPAGEEEAPPVARPIQRPPAERQRAIEVELIGEPQAVRRAPSAPPRPRTARPAPRRPVTVAPLPAEPTPSVPKTLVASLPTVDEDALATAAAEQLRAAVTADLIGRPELLRKAIVLAEILGPPRALKPLDDWMDQPERVNA